MQFCANFYPIYKEFATLAIEWDENWFVWVLVGESTSTI